MATEKALAPIKQVASTLQGMEETFKQALPPQVPSQKFIRTILTAIQNEDIAEKINSGKADKGTLFLACQKAASDGLVIDNREAALVTFWNKQKGLFEFQYMPMVGGIIKKVRNSGELSTISAHVVYSNDTFEHTLGVKEDILHVRPKLGQDRGDMIGVYAVAHLKDGSHQICVMDKKQVENVEECAKSKTVWKGPFADQQWEKTAIRRLCKRLPMSSDLERLFEHDNEGFEFDPDNSEVKHEPVIAEAPKKSADTRASRAVKSATKKEPEPKGEEIVDAEIVDDKGQDAAEEQADII